MLPDSLRAHQPPDTPEVEQEIHICAVDGKVIVRNIVTGHEAKFPPGSRTAVLRVFGAQVPHQGGSSELMLPMLALLAARAPRSKSNEWTQEAADAWVSAAELERYRASNTRPRWSQVLSWLRRLQDTGLVQYQVGSNTERTKPRARFCVPASFDPPLDGSPTEEAVDQWLRAHADVEYQPKRSPATSVSTSLDERQPGKTAATAAKTRKKGEERVDSRISV